MIIGAVEKSENANEEIMVQLRIERLKDDLKDPLRQLLYEYIDVFRSLTQKLTCTTAVRHRIVREETTPIAKRPYRIPHTRKHVIEGDIKDMLDNDII